MVLDCKQTDADNDDIDCLKSLGLQVDAVFDGFVTARIPADALEDMALADGVKCISLAQPLYWCNDSALFFSNIAPACDVGGYIGAFDGRDVIVGIIDSGIDFNHINLCDESLNLRVNLHILHTLNRSRIGVDH